MSATSDTSEYWYVAEHGCVRGPYLADMVRERLDNGDFSQGAIVWRSDMLAWEPIGVHFPPIETPESATKRRKTPIQAAASKWLPRGRAAIWLWSCLAVSAVALGLIVSDVWQSITLRDSNLLPFLLLCDLAVMIVAGFTAVVLWWRFGATLGNRDRKGGVIKVVAIIYGIAIVILVIVNVAQVPTLYRVQTAREAYRHYSVNVDILGNAIRVEGLLGPGLAREVEKYLDANAGIKKVIINSYGGLVDEALETAKAIKVQGNLATVADKNCNSACIIIFMAGKTREADRRLNFGFHAMSPITRVSAAEKVSLEELDRDAWVFLMERGVPKSFIDDAQKVGAERLVPVSAIRMADIGTVTQLLDGATPISGNLAKWLFFERALRQTKDVAGAAELFETIRTSVPTAVDQYAPSLWAATLSGSKLNVAGATRAMVSALAKKALPSASDEAVMKSIQSVVSELVYLGKLGAWATCAAFVDGKETAGIQFPPALANADFAASAALIRSAADRNWAPVPVGPGTDDAGKRIVRSVATSLSRKGFRISNLDRDPRVKCLWSWDLLSTIAATGPTHAPNLYRWLVRLK